MNTERKHAMSEDGTTNEDGTTGEFVTVVLVYRTHGEAADSVHEKLVSELPYGDEIMFLSVNDGVTESALALGADQSSWAYDDELLDDIPEPTYTIKRFWLTGGPTVLQEGVTLEEAQEHCNDPETSSSTATSPEAVERTETFGPWFDGYEKED